MRSGVKLYGEANGQYPAITAAFYNVGLRPAQPLLSRPGRTRTALALGPVGLLPWPLGPGRLVVCFNGLVAFSGLLAFGFRGLLALVAFGNWPL